MTPARRWLLLAGFVLTIFGSKLWQIDTAGSDLPVLDQWDGELEHALRPWIEQRLTTADLTVPHNEHRIITARLYSIAVVALTGQWNGLTETTLNAAFHALSALLLLLGASRWLQHRWLTAFGGLLLLLFALPFSWENTLIGFQIPFYFLQIFSLAHVYFSLESERFSWRWVLGQLCALLALASMASGFLAAAAVLAALIHRAVYERRLTAQQWTTAALAAGFIAVGWWAKVDVAGHAPLKAQSLANFCTSLLAVLAWPGPAWLPWVFAPAAFVVVRAFRPATAKATDPCLLGLLAWGLLQCAALAYSRGGGTVLASRYFDLLSLNVALGFLLLAVSLAGRLRIVCATCWLSASAVALIFHAQVQWHQGALPLAAFHQRQQSLVRQYLQTTDANVLRARTWPEIPHPNATILQQRLDVVSLQSILPVSVKRPIALGAGTPSQTLDVPASLHPSAWPVAFSSFGAVENEPFRWRSETQPAATARALRFRVAGDLGPESRGLTLLVKSAQGEVRVIPDFAPGNQWKTVTIMRPQGAWWIEATDAAPNAWFAFTEPVDLSLTTRAVEKLLKHHRIVLYGGALLLGLGIACHGLEIGKRIRAISAIRHRLRSCPLIVVSLAVLAVVSLPLGWLPPSDPKTSPLASIEPAVVPAIGESGWIRHGVLPAELPPPLRGLDVRGSIIRGSEFVGEHRTNWYRAASRIVVMVSGYPYAGSNRLELDVRFEDGSIRSIPFSGEAPRESWRPWTIRLPADATAVRIRAIDAATSWGGWLGFSEPFAWSVWQTFPVRMIAQVLATVGLAVVLVLGPGLVWRAYRASHFSSVLWPGPVSLAAGGGFSWALGGWFAPAHVAVVWIALTLIVTTWLAAQRRIWATWSATEARVLALAVLCVFGCAAKATFSGGPSGELYSGQISRTLEVGDRSDSRISYNTSQLIAHHLSPNEPAGRKYFLPWEFGSRGPIAGLAAAPIVLATGGRPPFEIPTQAWAPYDQEGFAAYRIATIALSVLSLIAVAALLLRVTDEERAWRGTALLVLAPFFWHELYFTWPKFLAAAAVLAAFQELLDRRTWRATAWLGFGYLSHPLALLSVPFLGIWILMRGPAPVARRVLHGALLGGGLLAVVGLWNLTNLQHASQSGFLHYFLAADGVYGASLQTWWLSRWNNFANTFIPFYVQLVNSGHPAFNAIGTRSSGVVHFFFQYWTAAPFAVGLLTSLALLPAWFWSLRQHFRVAAVTLLAPALFLILYWGAATTGLMREGGHVIFLSGWVFFIWAAGDKVPAWVLGRTFSLVRAIEVLAMMFVPSMATASPWLSDVWLLNDGFWLLVAAASLGGVAWQISRTSESETNNSMPLPERAL